MLKFDPTKLTVTFLPPANADSPLLFPSSHYQSNIYPPYNYQFNPYTLVAGRTYTFIQSSETNDMFLSIGYLYNTASIHPHSRDEILAQWVNKKEQLVLFVKVYVSGGEFDEETARRRFYLFQRKIDAALTGIVSGDQQLYTYFPSLLNSPIYIFYESIYPEFSRIVYFGTPKHYLHTQNPA